MQKKHVTPQVLKDKLKADFTTLNELKAKAQQVDQMIQDFIGAYVLGAGLPTTSLKFDENFDLSYEVAEGEDLGEPEVADLDEVEMEVVKSPKPKAKVR